MMINSFDWFTERNLMHNVPQTSLLLVYGLSIVVQCKDFYYQNALQKEKILIEIEDDIWTEKEICRDMA